MAVIDVFIIVCLGWTLVTLVWAGHSGLFGQMGENKVKGEHTKVSLLPRI